MSQPGNAWGVPTRLSAHAKCCRPPRCRRGSQLPLPAGIDLTYRVMMPDDFTSAVPETLLNQSACGLRIIESAPLDQADDEPADFELGRMHDQLSIHDSLPEGSDGLPVVVRVRLASGHHAEASQALQSGDHQALGAPDFFRNLAGRKPLIAVQRGNLGRIKSLPGGLELNDFR